MYFKQIHSKSIQHSMKRTKQQRPGFSLVELMVVLVILGMLAGVVAFKTRSYLVSSKQNAARVEISKICEALGTFYAAYDRYPTNDEGLAILARPSEKFVDGLLSKLPKDPWGRPYQYNNPGRTGAYDVISYGEDGREGGDGANIDLTNHDEDNKAP